MSSLNISSILTDSANKLNKVQPSSVGVNSLLWAGAAAVTILAFNILRPRNKIVYEPKVKYHAADKKPPTIKNGFFDWVSPLVHTKEPELLDKVGLDATTFLRFLRLMRWLFFAVSVFCCVVLIPVNITYSIANTKPAARDALSILTIRDVKGNLLFVHVAAVYIVTLMVLGGIWMNWTQMVRLRHEWFLSDEYQKSFYARTLVVLDVPRKLQSDEGLMSLFESLQIPYPTTAVHIGRRVGRLPELVTYHNDAVRELEQVLVRYLRGGRIGPKRPTITRGGCMGCGGTKADAIDFYTNKLKKTEGAIEQWRNDIDLKNAEPYGFASFASVPYAHVVAQKLQGKHPRGTSILLAPNPKDIIWENLNQTAAERRSKHLVGMVWLVAICFLNTVPLLIISALANLNALASIVEPINAWGNKSPQTLSLAASVLPPVVSALFGYALPIIMRWLARFQGAVTRTRLDRAVVARYFGFLVLSQLFIFSLIGVAIGTWAQISQLLGNHAAFVVIIKHLNKLPEQILTTYISQANYWLTFFPLRGFLAVFDLAQVIKLAWTMVKTRLFGRTPRDIRDWTQPPDFEYAIYYSNLLFMAAVGLVFAPLAPLVGVACAVVFWISSVVYKYQLMFVFVTKIESGGRLWNVAMNRLLVSCVLMQLLMTLTILLREGFRSFAWIATLPPIFMVLVFKFVARRRFGAEFRYFVPGPGDAEKIQVHSGTADAQGRLEKRFGHPALHADLFTPLVHAKMVALLPQVYHGTLGKESAPVDEYAGRKFETQVLPGGIKIAGVEQRDLEYDPSLYGRDRGEADWDKRSSHHLLNDAASFAASKASLTAGRVHAYLSHGPSGMHDSTSQIELAALDTTRAPLLPHDAPWSGPSPTGQRTSPFASPPAADRRGSPAPAGPYGNPQHGYSASTHSLSAYPPIPVQQQQPSGDYFGGQGPRRPSGDYLSGHAQRQPSGDYLRSAHAQRPSGDYLGGHAPRQPSGDYLSGYAPRQPSGDYLSGHAPRQPSGDYLSGHAPRQPSGDYLSAAGRQGSPARQQSPAQYDRAPAYPPQPRQSPAPQQQYYSRYDQARGPR